MNNYNIENTLVLNNIPSNLIEKATVVLKKDIKPGKIEQMKKICNSKRNIIEPQYILQEAEYVISDYIDEVEKECRFTIEPKMTNSKKTKRILKVYSAVATLTIIAQFILLIVSK